MRVILPAAGRGTRMAAVTGGIPKEALPLGASTVLGQVADECVRARLALTLVWSPTKGEPPIHLGPQDRRIDQPEPRGFGDAVRCGLGEEGEVLIALPDVVLTGEGPLGRLRSAIEAGADFAVAVEDVSPERIRLYGIVEIAGDEDWRIERLIEKPGAGETASRWAIASRYALGPAAVARLRDWPGDGEFGMTEVLQSVLDAGGIGLAVPLTEDEARYDCGSPEGYAAAKAAFA